MTKVIGIRPMLAASAELNQLKFPLFASAKLDGIRAINWKDQVLSRSLKPIPNRHVQSLFGSTNLHGLDGELIVGEPNAKDVYRVTHSAVMTQAGQPDVKLYVFDDMSYPEKPFMERVDEARMRIDNCYCTAEIEVLPQRLVSSLEELLDYESELLALGFEGVILRHPRGRYKFGRSTVNQQWMLKLKRFVDAEAEIMGMVELMTNNNAATVSELGLTTRSSHKDNKVPAGIMGALLVVDHANGFEFEVGTGFTHAERAKFWGSPEDFIGKTIKYKYFEVGMKDQPRHPVYLGMRDKRDL